MNANQQPTNEDVALLCHAWIEAKRAEEKAKEARLLVEKKLGESFDFKKAEGSKTFKSGAYKVVLKAGINYRLDPEKWAEVEGLIPDGMRPIKVKLEVDEAGAKYLRENEPEIWKVAAQAITTTPAKLGVKVEQVQEGA